MKIIFRLIIFSLLTPLIASAQSKTVTGTINDELGLPLPGVTVQVKDSNNLGAVTNFDGVFKISIPSESTQVLIFSYIGYLNEEIDVSVNTNITVKLIPSILICSPMGSLVGKHTSTTSLPMTTTLALVSTSDLV